MGFVGERRRCVTSRSPSLEALRLKRSPDSEIFLRLLSLPLPRFPLLQRLSRSLWPPAHHSPTTKATRPTSIGCRNQGKPNSVSPLVKYGADHWYGTGFGMSLVCKRSPCSLD